MLYIASALTPTPVLASLRVTSLTDNHTSLVVAKPDKLEVWDVTETGLVWVAELKVWGTIVSIDQVSVEGSRPHIVILLSPPNARALMVAFDKATSALVVTSSQPLSPPTPTLRAAEFFSAIVAQERIALVSLWIGVISCLEIEVDRKSSGKKKRLSKVPSDEDAILKFRDNYNINIREHNVLHISFLPISTYGPTLTFLWLTATNELRLQARSVMTASHSLADISLPIDVVQPASKLSVSEDTDFNGIPFSCPAARRVVPVPSVTPDGVRSLLVIGDEHTVLYTLSPRDLELPDDAGKATSGPAASPRANARRSPQEELTSGNAKRRKASMGGSKAATAPTDGRGLELVPRWRIRQGFGTVLAAEILEDHCTGASAIIGDEYGALTAVGWEFQKGDGGGRLGTVQVLQTAVDSTSPPSSLTYLDASHLFVSSAVADSVLLRLPSLSDSCDSQTAKSGKSKQVAKGDESEAWSVIYTKGREKAAAEGSAQVLERWMNVAPVKDMCAVKDASGGLSHLLLASGASESNSLRIIRSGVGLEELTNILGLDSVERMWPITNSGISQLLLSTPTSTILLQIEPTISIENTSQGFSNSPTLAAGIASEDGRLVQVIPKGLYVWADVAAGVLGGQMEIDEEIVCAQVVGEWVVIAMRGGGVSVFKAATNGFELQATKNLSNEVSAVSIFQGPLPSPIVAIATWTTQIYLYTLSQLADSSKPVVLTQEAYATSLQLKSAVAGSHSAQLLAGLSNGTLLTYDISVDNEALVSKSRKSTSLGSQPLVLFPTTSPQDGPSIISIGITERMSVIFESNSKTEFSSVNKKDILAVADLQTSSGPVFAVYSASSGLSLVRVTSLKKLHVQTCDMGSTSTSKLAHVEHLGAVACGATKRLVLKDGDLEETNWVEIRDESALGFMASYTLKERELVTSIRSVLLYGTQYLAVGTALLPEEEGDSWDEGNLAVVKEGRVLLFKAEQESGQWRLGLEMEVSTVGAVYALETIHGFLAVAAGSELVLFSVSTEVNPGHPKLPNFPNINRSLTRVASWASAFVISHLAVIPPFGSREDGDLIVGDGMRSVIVLQVDEGSGKIYDDERDMATHGVVALGRVQDGGEGIVIADSHANIMTYRLSSALEKAATFGLHEEVSKFQSGSLVPSSSAPEVMTPDVLYTTRDGRLGVIGQLTDSAARTLDDLQRNMEREWKGPGEVGWRNWRRAGTEVVGKETVGFVDGDFVQHFLEPFFYESEERDKVLQGASSHEHISKIGENGKEQATLEDVVRLLEATASMH
ncbi:hypothetical protein L202_06876 [Cryptococcus amylolentus CBS 6039]|uniref:DNA damage-binding protein 1 n=1 Tax=Cryptococcus amylolentus CBS 6039 TaxID=1295533 RepID=A0A1E3HEC2_9TREE|nr:hypothetical protein L202_06876 [Cryptococcus amylolentus CBS 6039]ODN74495.1 hypothetical protein L202_06876 [Cryptococcus amylolentus CBS 6039]